ncbi:Calmodulin-binding receptor-like cytoplasmic kinase 3 [Zea mays]|uniref:Calmodulin-binding receptor-like cytoplasmic kinase 3 n=1 Tax=Zea mays TaxID=4577 RepID=A0A1D6E6N2_MAIZE|nr:Calmodulin-binding receptor-like cytoplasmic kinase 3 [Zea mays]
MVAATTAGMFLVCFESLCPCFGSKSKDGSEDHVLAEYSNSLNSSEMRSISDRIAASPLRVPASPSRFSLSSPPSRNEPLNISLEHVVKLTHNFAPTLMIGEGYFGKVYRAALLDGRVVAIKRAKKVTYFCPGNYSSNFPSYNDLVLARMVPVWENFLSLRAEFSNEVALLKSIEHKNLVQLLGYIDKANERILITEYISNGTLREHLDGQHGLVLGFNQRLEIAIDVAHGLTYLHLYAEKPIIHRDVKSSNILLTEAFMAKVADFGFARTGPTEPDQSQIETDVRGTAGYLDPEYMGTSHLTIKSDVFSYGILLLEILSGRRPIERTRGPAERITVRWVCILYPTLAYHYQFVD